MEETMFITPAHMKVFGKSAERAGIEYTAVEKNDELGNYYAVSIRYISIMEIYMLGIEVQAELTKQLLHS